MNQILIKGYIKATCTAPTQPSWSGTVWRLAMRNPMSWPNHLQNSTHIYLWSPDKMSVCGREPSQLDGRGGSEPVSQLCAFIARSFSSQTSKQRSEASHHYSAILLSWVCIIDLSLDSQYITDYTPTTTHSNLRIPFTPMTDSSDAFCSSLSHLHVTLPRSRGISGRSRVSKASQHVIYISLCPKRRTQRTWPVFHSVDRAHLNSTPWLWC